RSRILLGASQAIRVAVNVGPKIFVFEHRWIVAGAECAHGIDLAPNRICKGDDRDSGSSEAAIWRQCFRGELDRWGSPYRAAWILWSAKNCAGGPQLVC